MKPENYEIVAPKSLDGERLDRAIALLLSCGRTKARSLIEEGNIFLNSKIQTSASHKIKESDLIQFELDPADLTETPPEADSSVSLDVLHEDTEIVVINKPAGLVVHPGSGNMEKTLVNGLLAEYPEIAGVGEVEAGQAFQRPGIVHRLDKDTSGVMLVARNMASYKSLSEAIAKRDVVREYGAISWGIFKDTMGIVDAPIARSNNNRLRMSVQADGKPARTHYHVEQQFSEAAVLHCALETGRTHQIRVHLASIGHPVVGDAVYGTRKLKNFELNRLGLYAKRIAFRHPKTDEEMEFMVDLPKELEDLSRHLSSETWE